MLEHEPQQPQTTFPTIPAMYNGEREAIERSLTPLRTSALDSEAYVAPLFANLRKIKSLRHLTDEQLRSEAHTPEIFELLRGSLMRNSELHWREKIIATWALSRAALDESQRSRTVSQLYDIIGKYGAAGSASWLSRFWNSAMRVGKWVLPLAFIGGVIAVASLIGNASADIWTPSLPYVLIWLSSLIAFLGVLLTPFVVPYSLMIDADHYHEVRAAAVRALRTLGGVESLDLVAKMALESSPMTSGPARGTLAVLLSKLTPEHYSTLPVSLVPDLCRILKYEAAWLSVSTENHTLALRVAEALEKIGDGHAAVVVEKLLKSSVTPQLKQALWAALPILQERRTNENAREMLLRHAAMPPASPEQLLRPALETVSQSNPTTLVRAANAPTDTEQT